MSSMTNEYKEKAINAVLESISRGANITQACDAAEVSRWAFWNWRKENPELAEKVEAIENSKVEIVEDALYKTAVGKMVATVTEKYKQGKLVEKKTSYALPNVAAQIFFLTNRASDKWKNNRDHFFGERDKQLADTEYAIISDTEDAEAKQMLKEVLENGK